MGLKHPIDLTAWQRWQNRQNRAVRTLRKFKHRSEFERTFTIYARSEHPQILSTVETDSPTAIASQLSWLSRLDVDYAIAAPNGMGGVFGEDVFETTVSSLAEYEGLEQLRAVAAWGHYLPIGQDAYRVAQNRGINFYVIQHGLLTALNPPLPAGAHLLAWSEADAEFWKSGRSDVRSTVVGSQLLWNAAQQPPISFDVDASLTYLGQLHGAELSQAKNFLSATRFCHASGAQYRPHPMEKDFVCRRLHTVMKARGVTFADGGIPLKDLRGAVVSAFSTGVLEAATKGLPAYVHFDSPPLWLEEFWSRYGMSRYSTGRPTPAPSVPTTEPASAIAAVMREAVSE